MIDVKLLNEFKSKYPDMPVVCYINSTAEVKAECDICCTSSNAIKVIKSLDCDEILFLPDSYLGKWCESQLENIKIRTYSGYCPTHLRIFVEDVELARKNYPNAKILAHPECHTSVSSLADFVGSTKEIMKFVKESSDNEFVIATEKGVVDRLKRDYPQKKIHLIKDNVICKNMKWNTLEDIYYTLLEERNEINIGESVRQKAFDCIDKMMRVV